MAVNVRSISDCSNCCNIAGGGNVEDDCKAWTLLLLLLLKNNDTTDTRVKNAVAHEWNEYDVVEFVDELSFR